jgi:hypothetical protein
LAHQLVDGNHACIAPHELPEIVTVGIIFDRTLRALAGAAVVIEARQHAPQLVDIERL